MIIESFASATFVNHTAEWSNAGSGTNKERLMVVTWKFKSASV